MPEFKSGLCLQPENDHLTNTLDRALPFPSETPSQKHKGIRANLTWSMSCWLTAVSPLLKSTLASEAKASRDRRRGQTTGFAGVNPRRRGGARGPRAAGPRALGQGWDVTSPLRRGGPGRTPKVRARALPLVPGVSPEGPSHRGASRSESPGLG